METNTMADDMPSFGAAPTRDPDLDEPTTKTRQVAAAAGSPLETLRAEAQREIGGETVTLTIKERPGWSVRYRADVEIPQFNQWRKRCADRSQPDGVDELKLACLILANQCEALVLNGEDLLEDDQPVTYASPSFHASFGVTRAVDAVRAWYGIDAHVMTHSQEVMLASGYGDEAEREDPTPGSSRP